MFRRILKEIDYIINNCVEALKLLNKLKEMEEYSYPAMIAKPNHKGPVFGLALFHENDTVSFFNHTEEVIMARIVKQTAKGEWLIEKNGEIAILKVLCG